MGKFIVIYILQSLFYLVKEYIYLSIKCSCSRYMYILHVVVSDDFKKYKFFGCIMKDVMVSMRHYMYHKLNYLSHLLVCTSLGKFTCAED